MATIRDDGKTISSGTGPGGPGGTVHAGGGDISSGFGQTPGGTSHAGDPDISSGHGASPASAGIALNVGDTLVINTISYQYQGVISKSSGEAEIFLISRSGKKCALKLYYPNFKPKEDIVKQLLQLNHEDIINVHDCGYYHDRFYEIMDYAEGGTLEKYLPIKDVKRVKQIITETINAFKFCHNQGIIHKDIKPQNLYYKNADGTDVLIGDFGISSLLESGMSRHLTSQSLTVGYAAPEMYGIGGKVYIGKEVDYYALGITLIHVWDGKSPFDGLGIHAISNLTTSGKVHIPDDMPKEIQKLVKGLITVDYVKRWGHDEVRRWLNGEDVPVHFQVKEISYPPYQFGQNETATTVEEIANLFKKYPDRAKKQLYSNKISAWINVFNQGLSSDLDTIVEDDYPKDQDAGIQKAIYILNPDEPYSYGGKTCRTTDELADELEADFSNYIKELTNPVHSFYLYLEAHDAKTEADTFRQYFSTFPAKKALNTIILELRGRESYKIGGQLFFSPEELLGYNDQQFIVNELKDLESGLSLWIEGSSFDVIKNQVEKWRALDWHDEVTIKFAILKSGPFGADSKDNADSCYKLAHILVSSDTERTLRALKMCLVADDAYFIRIATDKKFDSISSEIYQLLKEHLRENLSKRDDFIKSLRKQAPEHLLLKRIDKEQRLFDRKMKTIASSVDEQRKKQKNDADVQINTAKNKKADELKKKLDDDGDKNCKIGLAVASLVCGVLCFIYIDKITVWHFAFLGFPIGFVVNDKMGSSGFSEDTENFGQMVMVFICSIVTLIAAWIATQFITVKLLVFLCSAAFIAYAFYIVYSHIQKRNEAVMTSIAGLGYLNDQTKQIDVQFDAMQTKAASDLMRDIVNLEEDAIDKALAS